MASLSPLPPTRLTSLRRRPAAVYAMVFLFLAVLYVATGNINPDAQSPDAVAAALPAWHVVSYGTFDLSHVLSFNPWLVAIHHHVVSNRQPGVIFFGIPFYALLWHGQPEMNMYPAVVAAATSAAGAVTLLVAALRKPFGWRLALLAGALVALGTATWSVSADTLWPHGPDQLFLAAFLYFLSRRRQLPAALALALAVPVRAHLAVVALVAGVWLAVQKRSVKPLAVFGLPAALGIASVSAYNHWMFGTWSLQGGYASYVSDQLTGIGGSSGLKALGVNVLGTLFSLDRGLLVWCPVLLVLFLGLRRGWRASPDWVRLSAVGGVAYMLLQLKMNYFSGGDRFWSYRLSIEMLTLCVPLLAVSARELLRARPGSGRWLAVTAIYCVGTQAVGALFYSPENLWHSPWTHSKLAQVLTAGGLGPRVVMGFTVVGMVIVLTMWRSRGPTPADPVYDMGQTVGVPVSAVAS